MLKPSDFIHLSPALARRLGIDGPGVDGSPLDGRGAGVSAGGCGCAGGKLGPPGHDPSALADVQPPPGFADSLFLSLCSGSPDAFETITADWPKTESRHTSGSGAYYYRSCGYFLTDYRLLPTTSTSPKMFELSGGFWDMPGAVDPEQSRPYLSEDCARSRIWMVFMQRLDGQPWGIATKTSAVGNWSAGSCAWAYKGITALQVQQPEVGSAAITYRVAVRVRERTSGQEAFSMIRRITL